MLRFLILAGYFEMTAYLYISGKLDQYINLHFSYLAFLSMILSFFLAIVQLVSWMRHEKRHSHLTNKSARFASIALLLIPLGVTWLFPTVTLDATTVSAKGYHFPLAAGVDPTTQAQEGTTVQYLKPDTSAYFTQSAYQSQMKTSAEKYLKEDTITITTQNYMEVMEVIYDYPDAFTGKTITLTGFVYNDPDQTGQLFLFRFGIIHCIADSGVYGLLVTGSPTTFTDNSWVSATGRLTLTYHSGLKQSLPTLEVTRITETSEPENPYVYRVF